MKCFEEGCEQRIFITTGKGKYGLCWKCMQDQNIINKINKKLDKK